MPKKFSNKDKAEVHEELKGFNIQIDAFGQMQSSLSLDKLNTFLNKLNASSKNPKDKKEEEE